MRVVLALALGAALSAVSLLAGDLTNTSQFPIKDYAKSMAMLNRVPGPMGALFKRVYQETAKLKGVPLKTHITGLMGTDVTTEATDISTAAIPESTWALPAGYAMKDGGKEMKDAVKGKR